MMKIGEMTGQAADLPEPKRRVKERGTVGASKELGAARAGSPPAFAQAFVDASQATLTRALDTIMDELGRQGEKLAASQNFHELDKYKTLVKEFVLKATQGAAKLRVVDGGAQGRLGKVHVILQKVDDAMEALTREVLAKQATPIAILARLDQIRGLLLDLYK
ncbi:MAG TPA: YaaR family protein [bacterium]|jgi:uncharacterized protein YaaR (DUF327 family)|nr:YaaR family protein [bacterium]